MTKQEALDMLYEGDLYDAFGYVTADGYAALAALDGVVLQERKTGKWINEGQYAPYHGEDAFHCSLCGGHVIEYECQVYEMNPYCKWCGAKMKEEQNK